MSQSVFRGDQSDNCAASAARNEPTEEEQMMKAAMQESMKVPEPKPEVTIPIVPKESSSHWNQGLGVEEEKEEMIMMPHAHNASEAVPSTQELPPVAPKDTNEKPMSTHVTPADLEMWSAELRLLADMGFHDFNILIPLLRIHCRQKSTSGLDGKVDEKAVQHIVNEMLHLVD